MKNINELNLPENFIDNMSTLLGDELSDYLECFEKNPVKSIRINRNAIIPEDFVKRYRYALEQVLWTDNGFYVMDADAAISAHPYYYAGLYYIQEASAMSPAAYLPVQPTDMVLDLCAAPGGKATELATRCGYLLANDISASRAQVLLKNLEQAGAVNMSVTAESPDKLSVAYPEYFDKILVDAPCSGEGMFRKEPHLIKSWLERGPEYYHKLQVEILDKAYSMLKSGGYLLYSTCTFSRIEDEDTIFEFLKLHPDMEVTPLENRYKDFCPGLDGLSDAARLYPHKINGEGHFLCLLKKKGVTISYLEDRFKDWREVTIKEKHLLQNNEFDVMPGIRYLRSGLLLGVENKGRFSSSQARAMAAFSGIKNAEFDHIINLDLEDDRVLRYLRGETIDLSEVEAGNHKGEALLTVDNHPLGIGRVNNNRLKNDYPRSWMMGV